MLRSVTVRNSPDASVHFLLEAVIAASDGGRGGPQTKQKKNYSMFKTKHRNTKAKGSWKTVAIILL